ncbi:MAG: DNA-directed RNA polymerase subunit beta [Candidatus Nomurabacteria bacterium GW2011_GWA2_35_80]|uniref:DNA-directed RNA polymerase subunit beta n=1 Tax=Candidatus Nomurabacteria bacterium GW2011_GWA2_35_80 TaxID=1618733 RepID=A0A0G0D063_9BACT|nr:MAG: DNA-directed RNA polymerase subunit beta [Candidatus Nomurabacteria bacterium GW2011_GWA2_35_80]
MQTEKRPKKYFSRYKNPLIEFPNLIEAQTKSYKWLVEEGLKEVFKEFSPIIDYSGKKFELEFTSFSLSEPNCEENDAKINKLSYQGLLERVIVPQLARSFGVFFTESESKGKKYFGAKIIPARGVWIEIESESDEAIYIRIDKKRKFPATALLRVLGYNTNETILKAFEKTPNCKEVIEACLAKDVAKTLSDSYIEIYKRLRDGDMATPENAKEFINSLFTPERYDLSPVGRYRFNKRFDKSLEEKELVRRTISKEDLMTVIANIIVLNNTLGAKSDDIDHLGQRRVRFVGESPHQGIFYYQSTFTIYGARKCTLRNGALAYSFSPWSWWSDS